MYTHFNFIIKLQHLISGLAFALLICSINLLADPVGGEGPLALHQDVAPEDAGVSRQTEDGVPHQLRGLYPAHLPGGLHPAGHVDGVAPDVVLRLAAPHHARHHGAAGQTDPQGEHLTQETSVVNMSGSLIINLSSIMIHDLRFSVGFSFEH